MWFVYKCKCGKGFTGRQSFVDKYDYKTIYVFACNVCGDDEWENRKQLKEGEGDIPAAFLESMRLVRIVWVDSYGLECFSIGEKKEKEKKK